jgi:hypothetical protein
MTELPKFALCPPEYLTGQAGETRDALYSAPAVRMSNDDVLVAAETAAVLAYGKLCEMQQRQREGDQKRPSKRDRGLGEVQKQAVEIGAMIMIDLYGQSSFPASDHAMARAIVNKAAELGVDLDPRSSSVRHVAAALQRAARRMDEPEER